MKNDNRNTKQTLPRLRFTPTAWAKLLCLRDLGETEIGGFGIAPDNDPLWVEDVALVAQKCTWASVEFDDEAVADFFDDQVDQGRRPEEFARVWIHTHPGQSAQPSITDETTFARVFGRNDWAVMCILARGGQSYARLRFNIGPGGELLIPVEIDFSQPFDAADFKRWHEEYLANVCALMPEPESTTAAKRSTMAVVASRAQEEWWDYGQPPVDWYEDWHEYTRQEDLEQEAEELGYIHDF